MVEDFGISKAKGVGVEGLDGDAAHGMVLLIFSGITQYHFTFLDHGKKGIVNCLAVASMGTQIGCLGVTHIL